MYTRVRLTREDRKKMIINAAVSEALDRGLYFFSLANVAKRCGNTSKSTVREYFKTMGALRSIVVSEAILRDHSKLVCQALVNSHPATLELTDTQKVEFLAALVD